MVNIVVSTAVFAISSETCQPCRLVLHFADFVSDVDIVLCRKTVDRGAGGKSQGSSADVELNVQLCTVHSQGSSASCSF